MAHLSHVIELRQEGQHLVGTIIQEGRVARNLSEVFAPQSLEWSSSGVDLRRSHGGDVVRKIFPYRESDGRITFTTAADAEVREIFDGGRRHLSVEFISREESRNASGVREITRAILAAVAMVESPEYAQAKSEIRHQNLTFYGGLWRIPR